MENTEIITALEKWVDNHPEPDKPLLAVKDKVLSPRQILEEIKNGTELGKLHMKNLITLALNIEAGKYQP